MVRICGQPVARTLALRADSRSGFTNSPNRGIQFEVASGLLLARWHFGMLILSRERCAPAALGFKPGQMPASIPIEGAGTEPGNR